MSAQPGSPLLFQQLFEKESSTYTYLVADRDTREALLIDPVYETVDRDLKLIDELQLKLVYVLETHVHADHVTAASELRKRRGAKTIVSKGAQVSCADRQVGDGDEIRLGRFVIKAIETPGHTDSCVSYHLDDRVFTGDALLIRGCGRTDFQQGSSEKLYESVTKKLFRLAPETVVYPAHDYKGFTSSTIGDEMRSNPRLGTSKTQADFVKIMSELKLEQPKKIQEAVPANLACGEKKATSAVTG